MATHSRKNRPARRRSKPRAKPEKAVAVDASAPAPPPAAWAPKYVISHNHVEAHGPSAAAVGAVEKLAAGVVENGKAIQECAQALSRMGSIQTGIHLQGEERRDN